MSDLIERQAAIDAVEHITSSMSVCVNTDECHGMKRMQRQAVIELANLPSAQTEPCEDVEFWRKRAEEYMDQCIALTADMVKGVKFDSVCFDENGLAFKREQPEQRWIPCSGTIDIPHHEVLCCDRYGEELIGWLSYVDDQWLCESDV